MIKKVRKRVLDLPENQTLDTKGREELQAAIDAWFAAWSKHLMNKIKFAKTWTARLILYGEHKEEVHKIQAKLYEAAQQNGANPKRPFDFFQRAISKLWKQQSKTDRKVLEKLAKKWNKEGVSREQKQEYVIAFIVELAQTDSEYIGPRVRKHGNIRKSSWRTCTEPSGFASCSSLQWKPLWDR